MINYQPLKQQEDKVIATQRRCHEIHLPGIKSFKKSNPVKGK